MTQPSIDTSTNPNFNASLNSKEATQAENEVVWSDKHRQTAFSNWINQIAPLHQLDVSQVKLASADASFRRYLRVACLDDQHQNINIDSNKSNDIKGKQPKSRIIMDAPPDKENCTAFVQIAKLMQQAHLSVPEILNWDENNGFMLLSDLGQHTLMSILSSDQPDLAHPYYEKAVDALIQWQSASKAGVLPEYNETLLMRELMLFPDWYLEKHRQIQLNDHQKNLLSETFQTIIKHNLNAPKVFVHRDFMARNLMLNPEDDIHHHLNNNINNNKNNPKNINIQEIKNRIEHLPLGILDFQDAVYGSITYDIASLMRDAFLTWDEEIVLDITIRYWEKAKKAGLMDFEDWHSDFGSFYKSVEWMGLQRHLKIAGIFARLTLRDGKPKYLADAPRFIQYIRQTASRYRDLKPFLKFIDEVENIQTINAYAFGKIQ